MQDDVFFHNAAIVISPGHKGAAVAAPGSKLFHGFRETESVFETFFIEAGQLFDFRMHFAEIHRPDIYLKFFSGAHIIRQLYSADLDDFAAQAERQMIEHGGFGTHRLIPFQIQYDVVHVTDSFPSCLAGSSVQIR